MKTRIFFLALSITLIFASCERKGNVELYNEVMAIHDEVMPKMNDIHRYKKEFQKELADTINTNETRRAELQSIIEKLDAAGDGMMVWMRQFEPVPDSEGEDKAREYLESEKKKVSKVKDDMNAALDNARKLSEKR